MPLLLLDIKYFSIWYFIFDSPDIVGAEKAMQKGFTEIKSATELKDVEYSIFEETFFIDNIDNDNMIANLQHNNENCFGL